MAHPLYRPRRLRESPLLRRMVRETRLGVENLILPLFAVHGRGVRDPIGSMPGVSRLSLDELLKEAKDAASMGIPAILLFGVPQSKDPRGSEAYAEDGIVQQSRSRGEGDHSGPPRDHRRLPLPVHEPRALRARRGRAHQERRERGAPGPRRAVPHGVGADIVAPSDMMDGRVAAIRETLDEAGYTETPIMAYSAKYASAFYGPFREAVESAPQFGDRRSYQMDPANAAEAPARGRARRRRGRGHRDGQAGPSVSRRDRPGPAGVRPAAGRLFGLGEYAMIKAAAQLGWLDESAACWKRSRRSDGPAPTWSSRTSRGRRPGCSSGSGTRARSRRPMLAVVKDPAKRGIVLEDVPVPTWAPGRFSVRVRVAGICGSDQRIYTEVNPARRRRFISRPRDRGEVVAVGERVTEVPVGGVRRRGDLHRVWHLPALQGRPGQSLREAGRARRHRGRRHDRSSWPCPRGTSTSCRPASPTRRPSSRTPSPA